MTAAVLIAAAGGVAAYNALRPDSGSPSSHNATGGRQSPSPSTSTSAKANSSSSTQPPLVDAKRLGGLIRTGPFTESLPAPMKVVGLEETMMESIPAAIVDTIQLKSLGNSGSIHQETVFETFPSEQYATERSGSRLAELKQKNPGSAGADDTAGRFCIPGAMQMNMNNDDTVETIKIWDCGGTRGPVFVMTTLYPAGDGSESIASGTIDAAFRYVDRMIALTAKQ